MTPRLHDACPMVSETEPVRIIVEISRAEPFRGTIAERDQPVQSFNGWTAFAAAIAAVVRGIGPPAHGRRSGRGGRGVAWRPGGQGTPPRPGCSSERASERRSRSALDRAPPARADRSSPSRAPPGVGKTALIELAAELAAARGCPCCAARGSEIERDVPLSTLRGLFERHLVALPAARREALLAGAAQPLARALGPGRARPAGRRAAAPRRAVARRAGRRAGPLALLVDDLHHADASSLEALAAVARHLEQLPVVLILTRGRRTAARIRRRSTSSRSSRGRRSSPQPLTAAGVGAVLRERLGLGDRRRRRRARPRGDRGQPVPRRPARARVPRDRAAHRPGPGHAI